MAGIGIPAMLPHLALRPVFFEAILVGMARFELATP
jgi:hypothetical protein